MTYLLVIKNVRIMHKKGRLKCAHAAQKEKYLEK
jgi:hypothetical protein